MIEDFKYPTQRDSGVIYKSSFEQIKKLYSENPQLAGEYAISLIELTLCGDISSDNSMIDFGLENLRTTVERDAQKYERTKGAKADKQIADLRLRQIADMLNNGATQQVVADTLGISKQTLSYRVSVIKTKYPEWLIKKPKKEKPATEPSPSKSPKDVAAEAQESVDPKSYGF